MAFIAAWFYSAGTFLHSQHPPITHLNLKIFKLSLLVPLTYLVLICILVISWYFYFDNVALLFERSRKLTIAINANPFIFLLLMGTLQVLLLASILCVFYSIYFIVRALNIIEMGHSASFLDFTVDFLSILLFPVGLFNIQPKINRIMNNSAP